MTSVDGWDRMRVAYGEECGGRPAPERVCAEPTLEMLAEFVLRFVRIVGRGRGPRGGSRDGLFVVRRECAGTSRGRIGAFAWQRRWLLSMLFDRHQGDACGQGVRNQHVQVGRVSRMRG
eukprot:5798582-Pleurochrysis_carterae.AAC.1